MKTCDLPNDPSHAPSKETAIKRYVSIQQCPQRVLAGTLAFVTLAAEGLEKQTAVLESQTIRTGVTVIYLDRKAAPYSITKTSVTKPLFDKKF